MPLDFAQYGAPVDDDQPKKADFSKLGTPVADFAKHGTPAPDYDKAIADTPLYSAILEGYRRGKDSAEPFLTPYAQNILEQAEKEGGAKALTAKAADMAASGLSGALARGQGAISGLQAGVAELSTELLGPQFGRDVAAMPEAFAGMPGALHTPEVAPSIPRPRIEPGFDAEPGPTGEPAPKLLAGPPPTAPTTEEPLPAEEPSPKPEALKPAPEPTESTAPAEPELTPPVPETPSEKEETQPVQGYGGPWRPIGKNHIGDQVYENERGARAIMEPGNIPWSERLTKDMAPAGPDKRNARFQTEAEAKPPEDTTGLVAGLGGAGKAIGDNLRSMLWNKLQKGDTTELGQPSPLLVAAKANMDSGAIKTRADFDRFADGYAKRSETPVSVRSEPGKVPKPEDKDPEFQVVTPAEPAADLPKPAAEAEKTDKDRTKTVSDRPAEPRYQEEPTKG